jgi:hypothetical protein
MAPQIAPKKRRTKPVQTAQFAVYDGQRFRGSIRVASAATPLPMTRAASGSVPSRPRGRPLRLLRNEAARWHSARRRALLIR